MLNLNIFFIVLFSFSSGSALFCQAEIPDNFNLEELINIALENNPGIRGKKTISEMTKKEIDLVKSNVQPKVNVNAYSSLTNEYRVGYNFTSVGSGLSMSKILWQNGRNNALVKHSECLYLAELSELEAEKQQLILQVKLEYFNLLRYKKLYEVSLNNIVQAKLYLEAAKEMSLLGIGKQSDILKAESELADANYILKNINYSLKNTETQLSRLTGQQISEISIPEELAVEESPYLIVDSDSLFAIALNNYPELKALRNTQKSQDFYEKAAKADLYPRVSANASYDVFYNPQTKGRGIWIAGISANWDLLDGRRKKTQIQIEKLRNQSLQFQGDDLLLDLRKEIETRIDALQEAKDQIDNSKALKRSRAENLQIVEEEYRLGISSMLELSNAQADDFEASAKIINATTDYKIAIALIERAIGINALITK